MLNESKYACQAENYLSKKNIYNVFFYFSSQSYRGTSLFNLPDAIPGIMQYLAVGSPTQTDQSNHPVWATTGKYIPAFYYLNQCTLIVYLILF